MRQSKIVKLVVRGRSIITKNLVRFENHNVPDKRETRSHSILRQMQKIVHHATTLKQIAATVQKIFRFNVSVCRIQNILRKMLYVAYIKYQILTIVRGQFEKSELKTDAE